MNPVSSDKNDERKVSEATSVKGNRKSAKRIEAAKSEKTASSECNMKTCKLKKRGLPVPAQIKTIHNKSESGLKGKKCSMHRKRKSSKDDNIISKLTTPMSEHILIKTF